MQYDEEYAIKMERTEDYYKAARELSDYIKALPLPQPENDALVELIHAHVHHASAGALAQGFRMGMEFQKWNRARFFRRKKDISLEEIVRLLRP